MNSTEYPLLTTNLVRELFSPSVTIQWDKGKGYMSFRNALNWTIQRFSDESSEENITPDARELLQLVMKDMVRQIGDFDKHLLKFYPTSGSPLRLYHRVDGIFAFRKKIVVIDITANSRKTRGLDTSRDYPIPKITMYMRNGEMRYAIMEIYTVALILASK